MYASCRIPSEPDRVKGGSGLLADIEAPALIAGFHDLAMVGEATQESGGHLGVAEDTGPFTEGQVGRHDDRGPLVEAADQMEQDLTTGLSDGEITQFVHEFGMRSPSLRGPCRTSRGTTEEVDSPSLPVSARFGVEFAHHTYDVEEPAS